MDTLLKRLEERIKWDKRVSPADFKLIVKDGIVIVTGAVDTSYKKQALLEIISNTEGVWALEDGIIVPMDYSREDDEIREILLSEIGELIKIGGEHIEVEVEDGIVRLEGEVFRPRLKASAVSCAWELSGVRDVLNNIEIKDPPSRIPVSTQYESETLTSRAAAFEVSTTKEVS